MELDTIIAIIMGLITALIALGAVFVSFMSARTSKDAAQTAKDAARTAKDAVAASIEIADKQIKASAEIAERHIKAQLVSANRQKWIEELRSHIVEYVSQSSQVSSSLLSGKYNRDFLVKMNHHYRTINLYLNRELDTHRKLLSATEDLNNYINMVYKDQSVSTDENRAARLNLEFHEKVGAILRLTHDCLSAEKELIHRSK